MTVQRCSDVVQDVATFRSPRRRDIMAACGQLKSASVKLRASLSFSARLGSLRPGKRGFEAVVTPKQFVANGEGRRATNALHSGFCRLYL